MPAQSAIERLRGLLAEAEPGEWFAWAVASPNRHGVTEADISTANERDPHGYGFARICGERPEATRQLIIQAINSLPALLECAEKLDGMLDTMRTYQLPEEKDHCFRFEFNRCVESLHKLEQSLEAQDESD